MTTSISKIHRKTLMKLLLVALLIFWIFLYGDEFAQGFVAGFNDAMRK